MKKLVVVLIAAAFSAGAFAHSPVAVAQAGANPLSTDQTVARKHHKHHGKKKVIRHVG